MKNIWTRWPARKMNDERETTRKKEPGFTLTELMLAVTIGAILFSIVRPQASRARASSNEHAAIAALRSIASAQAQLVAIGAIDTDMDGAGEYGYLGELAGSAPLRVWTNIGTALEAYGRGLCPPILPIAFANTILQGGEAE